MTRYQKILSLLVLAGLFLSVYQPVSFHDWLIENGIVFVFLGVLFVAARLFQFSDAGYLCIAFLLLLHFFGTHYTYERVPFGYVLQEWFDASRNMYDRFVHFAFGFLMTRPAMEICSRAGVRVCGVMFFSFCLILAAAGVHEVIEWIAAGSIPSAVSSDYLGFQGDSWDTQKDIFMAGVGSAVFYLAMLVYEVMLGVAMYFAFRVRRRVF